jgi:5-methyltetrahydropteroyltriglutamate--homocysteine methyltransferase
MTAPGSGVLAYQHGIFPRSEDLVAATRDLERGRTTSQAVAERFRAERDEVVAAQREAGLDLLSDGLLRWQDLFRPLVEASDGMRAQTLVRWFDNNSFFRAPEVEGSPRLSDGLPPELEADGPVEGARVATLPSPYLFSRAAQGSADRDGLMVAVARDVLAPVAAELAGRGYGLIHLQEPWLAFYGIDRESWAPFEEALGAVRDAVGGRVPVVLHTYYGDAAPHAERLRALPVDAVGIDLVETDHEALGERWEVGVVAGCLDGRRSLVESADQVASFARRVRERLDPPAFYLSSGSDLELLPREVAERKVRLLGQAAGLLREAA